jgi:SNF2 family DNA or RNA helicase
LRTYGTLAYLCKQWIIHCEPHIALRFKRVFPKIDQRRVGFLQLTDTIDNARDLEWFMSRYPLETNDGEYLTKRASEHRERESIVTKLLTSDCSRLEFPMAIPPRDYQKQAAAILEANHSLLLADDVGLGKSVAAIAAFIKPQMRPVLVTTLAHLPKQWRNDFIWKFAPHLSVHILKKTTPYDIRLRNGKLPDVIISSYHKLAGWAETLGPIIKMIVFDECQELRKSVSAKYGGAEFLGNAAKYRMGLSATPFYNYGAEMFNVMNCIAPEALGSHSEFITEWCRDSESISDPKAFGAYMRESGLMLRRTRKDVGRELPPCQTIVQEIEIDGDVLGKLEAGCEELARVILANSEANRGDKMRASAEFDMRMRQATGIAKAPYIAEFVRMLADNGEPIVVYAWHREVYTILKSRLANLNPVMYTGSESVTQKQASKEAFVRGDSRVMLISLRSGAGLDGLQKVCSTVVFAELDWSPGVHEQNIGRVFRDGQESPVFAYFPLSTEGSDPVVSDVCGIKSQQIEGVKNPDAELVQKLEIDPDHIKKMAVAYLQKNYKKILTG